MDTTVLIALSSVFLGLLMLVCLAAWLAADRQRPIQQSGPQPNSQPQSGEDRQTIPRAPEPYQQPTSSSAPAAPASQSSSSSLLAAGLADDPSSSAEYPAAALYDQTLLPGPRQRSRKTP